LVLNPADGESLLGSGRGQQLMKTLCKLIAEHPCNEFSKQDQDKPLRSDLASLPLLCVLSLILRVAGSHERCCVVV
jgi:hypothetical protein